MGCSENGEKWNGNEETVYCTTKLLRDRRSRPIMITVESLKVFQVQWISKTVYSIVLYLTETDGFFPKDQQRRLDSPAANDKASCLMEGA